MKRVFKSHNSPLMVYCGQLLAAEMDEAEVTYSANKNIPPWGLFLTVPRALYFLLDDLVSHWL